MTHKIDAKTPKGQAMQMRRALRKEARLNGRPDDVFVGEHKQYPAIWTLSWEEGPFEWTYFATGGCDIWAEDFLQNLHSYLSELELRWSRNDALIRNMRDYKPTFEFAPHVTIRPVNSFELSFHWTN